MRQVLVLFGLAVLLSVKNAVAGNTLLYFFSEKPARDVVENALHFREKCGVEVIGVVRGILPGETLTQAVKRLNKHQKEGFAIWIDPTLFELFQIEAVPCYVLAPSTFVRSRMCVGDEEVRVKKICGNLKLEYVLRRFGVCQ